MKIQILGTVLTLLMSFVSQADYKCTSDSDTSLYLINSYPSPANDLPAVAVVKQDGNFKTYTGTVTGFASRVEVYDSYDFENGKNASINFDVKNKPFVFTPPTQCGRGACDIFNDNNEPSYTHITAFELDGENYEFKCNKTVF